MKILKKILVLLFVVVIAEIVPYGFAKYINDFFREFITPNKPFGYFIDALLHRGVQFILVFILIKLLFKDKISKFGFNFNNKRLSLKIIAYVAVIWPVIIVGFFIISLAVLDGFREYLQGNYPLGASWIIAKAGRDILLIDAFAEEILYRSFVILVLAKYWRGSINIAKWNISYSTVLSVPIFMIAHVSLSIFPFAIISYDPVQLLLTFFTGLLFAISFEKTNSLFAPIIIHGYTNFIITIAGYLAIYLTR